MEPCIEEKSQGTDAPHHTNPIPGIVHADVEPLSPVARIEELARMLAGGAITAKTRAHAKELLETGRRRSPG